MLSLPKLSGPVKSHITVFCYCSVTWDCFISFLWLRLYAVP